MRIFKIALGWVCLAAMLANPCFSEDGPKRVTVGKLRWTVPNVGDQLLTNQDQIDSVLVSLRTMMTTALQKTMQFDVVDREGLSDLVEELSFMYDSGMVDPDKAVEWGKHAGADHLILGTVTQFTEIKSKKGFAGIGGRSTRLMMVVDLRLVSTETGEILIAEEINSLVTLEKDFSMGVLLNSSRLGKDSLGYEGGFGTKYGLGQQLDLLLRSTAEQIIGKVVSAINPIEIIQLHNESPILNYGNGLLTKGMVLDVYRSQGDPIVISGKEFPAPKINIGQLIITESFPELSMTETIGNLRPEFLKVGDECRVASPADTAKAEKARKKRRTSSR